MEMVKGILKKLTRYFFWTIGRGDQFLNSLHAVKHGTDQTSPPTLIQATSLLSCRMKRWKYVISPLLYQLADSACK